MNAVEIEEAVSALAAAPFDPIEFPYAFLAAFGTKETTLRRLRNGSSNSSNVPGGVLQRYNIHLATCAPGEVDATLKSLLDSQRTASAKVKFVLATDGVGFAAEEVSTGEMIVDTYGRLAEHFGVFLPLAGISTVREIKHNPIDVKATGRLEKLYIELSKHNPGWTSGAQFMARLIFCFFAEDTGILPQGLFTTTVREMTEPDGGNVHEVISALFRAMDMKPDNRKSADLRLWAERFPYVNGGLFTGSVACPKFSRTARSYLLGAGELGWKEINPDIFGSMIQAIADPEERGSLGMHYTSVPNILKVLNPLFLDDLRAQLEAADDNARKLRNLRRRIASIRVFDPACGSGNFLVIAYQKMREIEAEIIRRLGEDGETHMKLENFFGVELKPFPVEIAKLSLLIAEFQCDVRFRGERIACLNVLPLHRTGQIHVDNALRRDWLELCPPASGSAREQWDLGGPTGRLPLEENGLGKAEEIETYICGNPPYKGSQDQTAKQKADLAFALRDDDSYAGSADYVLGWFMNARRFMIATASSAAFVTTNSIHQGRQVSRFWPQILGREFEISFAEPSFKWSNLAAKKAAVIVSIIGLAPVSSKKKRLFSNNTVTSVDFIGPYLVPNHSIVVQEAKLPISRLPVMTFGSMPNDGGNLLLNYQEARRAVAVHGVDPSCLKPILGTKELTGNLLRYCIWIKKGSPPPGNQWLKERFELVAKARNGSKRPSTKKLGAIPHLFGEVRQAGSERVIVVSGASSENRNFLPADVRPAGTIVSNLAFALLDEELWNFSVIVSRIHLVWIATVCGKLKNDYRYSNTLGWNTFPIPILTAKNREDLTRCAEEILLAREAHFPKTIAELYDPENMPEDLRRAHERNDETLERIYIGRRFKNDTDRLEKLFDLYTKMTAAKGAGSPKAKATKKAKANS